MPVVVLPSARFDIRSASEWYEHQQDGLGYRFRQQVIEAIDTITGEQIDYAPAYMSLSRVFVKKFPYLIYFKKDSKRDRTVIYAVLHKKQDRSAILPQRV